MEENLTLLFAHDVRNYSILNFAYMGDTVLELFTREYLLKTSGKTKPGELVTASRRYFRKRKPTFSAAAATQKRILHPNTAMRFNIAVRPALKL